MSEEVKEPSKLQLGEGPIECTYHHGRHDPRPGVFHRFVDDFVTDEGNNKFAVTYALVEDPSGNLYKVEPQYMKLKR